MGPFHAWLLVWLPLIKDGVTTGAAFVAAVVAIIGLQTWKKQLTANAEHTLAKRVLVAVYKVRDAINNCRMTAIEGEDAFVTKTIHERMFDKLDEANAILDAELLEAEAVWGDAKDYRTCVIMFTSHVTKLKSAYWRYYLPSEDADDKKDTFRVLFTQDSRNEDVFSLQLERAVKGIEQFLRPKLTLKQGKKK